MSKPEGYPSWYVKFLLHLVCIKTKKKPTFQVLVCNCRIYGRDDFGTLTGLKLCLLSNGAVTFLFLLFLLVYVLIAAASFLAIEPSAFEADYGTAVYFTFVTLTTIGYGNVTLKCNNSRLLEFFFIIFGIPLTAVTFTLLGSTIWRLQIPKPTPFEPKLITKLKSGCRFSRWVTVVILWLSSLVLTSVIYSYTEYPLSDQPPLNESTAVCLSGYGLETNGTWGYPVGFYFAWVTMTTVGYGDYYQKEARYRVLNSLLSVVGLTVYALIVSKCGGHIIDYFDAWYKSVQEEDHPLKELPEVKLEEDNGDEKIDMHVKEE